MGHGEGYLPTGKKEAEEMYLIEYHEAFWQENGLFSLSRDIIKKIRKILGLCFPRKITKARVIFYFHNFAGLSVMRLTHFQNLPTEMMFRFPQKNINYIASSVILYP